MRRRDAERRLTSSHTTPRSVCVGGAGLLRVSWHLGSYVCMFGLKEVFVPVSVCLCCSGCVNAVHVYGVPGRCWRELVLFIRGVVL